MENVDFGQIPFEVICRFGELGKTEIRVLSYLYACRNQKTGQCNPSRKKICTDTELSKTHLSTALKNLDVDGWIFEDAEGFFFLTVPEKVTKTVTSAPKKVTDLVTKVTKTVTKVTDSVTKSYENGNSLIKELNIEGNRERTEKEQRSAMPKKIGSRLPENFALDDSMIDWAKSRAPDISINLETEKFTNYWRAKAGKAGIKLDWLATWRNWFLQAQEWANERKNGTIQQNSNFKSSADKREERAINDYHAVQQVRARVEARRNRNIP